MMVGKSSKRECQMRSKFFHAIAVAGIFALAGCSDEAKPTPVSLGEGPENPELSLDSEGGELPPNGGSEIFSSDASTLPGTSSPSGNNTQPGNNTLPGDGSSASGDNGNPLGTSSSENGQLVSSSSQAAQEQTFAFGYALKNAPRPSKGCGKNSSLQSIQTVENGQKYQINVSGRNRTYFLTLPKNYNNTKPHKVLFANHCMGSVAEDFVHHTPDYDHPSPYYGQQVLDKNGDYIFVAPQGNDNGSWNGQEDHDFIHQLLTTIEDNYCVDTTRVFATGFSFGAMFTNSLAWEMQDRLRAVAVYAVAAYNIWLPENTGKPIAWMAVHGKNDGTCEYGTERGARNKALKTILKNNSAEGKDATQEYFKEIPDNTAGHVCHDFKDVDERFPVKFCSWNGPHRWPAHDEYDYYAYNDYETTSWKKSWVPEEVHKFFEQF
jgi:poly(3-hydroxybutyrate) depolymerase